MSKSPTAMYGMDAFNAIEAENAAERIQDIVDACEPEVRVKLLAMLRVEDIQPSAVRQQIMQQRAFASLTQARAPVGGSPYSNVLGGIFG